MGGGGGVSLAGRTALVTGAAGAIGAAITRALVADGAHVVMLDKSADGLSAVAAPFGDSVSPVTADLADPDAVEATAADLLTRFGRIDVFASNAGILSNNKLAATDLGEWHRVLAVNLDAGFLLARALVPAMREARWGRIVFTSSFAAKSGGLTAGTAYSVSKAALIGLTFTIAREVAAEGVTVNAVAPAYVMSPMVSEQLTGEQRQRLVAQIPVGRFCEPEEVAHTVSFLCSPLSGFITGEVIDMNGGIQFD
jgi:3-oxoacyl-[acyl-carrier protein] reductase